MGMAESIRLIVTDDHPVVLDGLVAILSTQVDFDVVGTATSGAELVRKTQALQPDIVLTDLAMPELDGVEAIRQIRAVNTEVEFIVFTAFDTDERIVGAVQAGAKGYLLKGAPREEIFRAIRVVSQGGSLLEPVIATRLLQRFSAQTDEGQVIAESLTEREMEVLQRVAQGKPNKEIAAELFITERTVKFYVSAILGKLGAGNRTEAVAIAAQRGLVKL
jgi:DNA-binding NarL/FixJ family response regulator